MSNEINNNQPHDESLSEFEQTLRRRSLGAASPPRHELMYQCGYAAGVASTRRQMNRMTAKWRAIGIAASILASLSFTTRFLSIDVDRTEQRDGQQLAVPHHPDNKAVGNQTAADTWVPLLTKKAQSDIDQNRVLRATENSLMDVDEGRTGFSTELVPSDQHDTPLRPSDFPLFL